MAMKIVLVSPYDINTSGVIVFAERLCKSLNSLGVKVILLVVGNISDINLSDDHMVFTNSKELNRWLLENLEMFDVLFWMGFYVPLFAIEEQISVSNRLCSQNSKCVYYMWERTGYVDAIPDKKILEQFRESCFSGVFVLNDDEFNNLRFLLPHKNLYRIFPGVDSSSQFVPVSSFLRKKDVRKKIGWKIDTTIILMLCRFTRRKDVLFIAETWSKISYFLPDTILAFVGSGFGQNDSVENELIAIARGNENICINQHDGRTDRISFYQGADVFVAAGVSEGEPTVLSEAMACELPILASDIAGHRQLVKHEETGLLFSPHNDVDFESKLIKMLKSPDLRMKYGKSGREKVAQSRDILVIANQLMEIFSFNIDNSEKEGK